MRSMNKIGKFVHLYRTRGLAHAVSASLAWVGRSFPSPFPMAAYDFIQRELEIKLAAYLRTSPHGVKRIVIVGAYLGFEVNKMLARYPNCRFELFEPSERYFTALTKRFKKHNRVRIHKLALADRDESIIFRETNLAGSGSILRVGKLAEEAYGMQAAESYLVRVSRLDSVADEYNFSDEPISCLWIDVQGAELAVLSGASGVIHNVQCIFVEVSVREPLYENGATWVELRWAIEAAGFHLVGLGTDPASLTGNAIFLRTSGFR